MSVSVSRRTAEIALRALRYMEPANQSWAQMPKEANARHVYADLVTARREIEDAMKGEA